MKRLFILLFSISLLLCAFGLRVHHLGRFSLWIDEGLTPLRASYNIGKIWANEIDIQESISKDTHPPLYYTVIHVTWVYLVRAILLCATLPFCGACY